MSVYRIIILSQYEYLTINKTTKFTSTLFLYFNPERCVCTYVGVCECVYDTTDISTLSFPFFSLFSL